MVQLTAKVQYASTLDGWHEGTLTYNNGVLSLTAEGQTVIFTSSIDMITKIKRSSIALTFYTTNTKQTVSFGDMVSYMAGISGRNITALKDAEQIVSSASAQMTPWLDVFNEHNIPTKGSDGMRLVLFQRKAYYVYFSVIIMAVIGLIWIYLLK